MGWNLKFIYKLVYGVFVWVEWGGIVKYVCVKPFKLTWKIKTYIIHYNTLNLHGEVE